MLEMTLSYTLYLLAEKARRMPLLSLSQKLLLRKSFFIQHFIYLVVIFYYIWKLLILLRILNLKIMNLFNQSISHHSRILILLFCLVFVSSINAQSISKNSEIYDYQVGDIFHFELNAYEPSSGSHVYTNIEIMGKYYSASQDTLFYIRSFATHESHSWAPNWAFSKNMDTIFITNLDSLVNSGNIDTVFTSIVFSGRKVNRIDDYGPNQNVTLIFVEGCGRTYYRYVQTSPNTDWESKLIYYKKGSEVWGTPIPLSVNQAQNTLSLVKIFPNPSKGVINIDVPKEIGDFEIRVFNVSGQLIVRMNNDNRIDLSNEPSGLYYIQLISEESTITQKLILI